MVVKKSNWLTHLILVILIVAILFPVVWVVSTSLRRDNAAFSSKLFSSRMSLQNYKDLLFPEDNVLRLLSDIEAITTNSRPYDEKPVEYLVEKFRRDIQELKNYSEESKSLIKLTDEHFSMIQSYVKEKSNEIIETILNVSKGIKEKVKVKKTSEKDLSFAILSLGKEKEFEGIDVSKYREEWEREFQNVKMEIKIKEKLIKELETSLRSIKKDMDIYQIEYRRLSTIIKNSIIPQVKSFNKTLKAAYEILEKPSVGINALVMENGEFEQYLKIYEIIEKISELQINKEIKSLVDELMTNASKVKKLWEKYDKKNLASYGDFISIINQFNLKSFKQLNEAENVLRNFQEVEKKYLKSSNSLLLISNRLESEKKELEVKRNELNLKEQKLLDAKAYILTEDFFKDVDKFIEKVSKYKLPRDINRLYISLKSLRRSVNSFLTYISNEEVKSGMRKDLRKLEWIDDYRDLIKRYEKYSKDVKEFLEKFDKYVESIELTGKNAIYSAKNGVKIRILVLSQLFTEVQSKYPAEIASSMSIASKAAADLMDIFPFDDLDKNFKEIDKRLFRFDQIWKQKQRHYLWRWILNSVVVAGLVSVITTFVNALAAYPFSRMRFRGRKYGIMSLLLIQMFPAIMYMIALYGFLSFMGRYIPWLGLNTLGGLIFVYLGNIAFNMYLIKGFYDTIPSSLEEAAMIDGATRWQTFWRIVLPLASPILAVVVILTFMGTFNEFVLAKIILQDVEKYTYAVGLWTFSTGPFETEWGLFSAAALVGMLPMVILFLSMQKYLVGGLTKGSVKG
ncbi:ABC transporter permease [Thermosipho melanesiensis]|uniref:Binding-protein-dependent transport systems inner membrane component n=2 Tax=Thermosipho melanesiensis TaxID=46541 RepID=A6LKL0_THEM4|nr:ABC transporter permease subunit [Thermosipho melanesiensis]ABR30461.1 binding-protein-dependent transport systems inner membrane component [Thermosipho melanesiensis BI429]APT73619.1 ABC transporter permease [Thermosipho melanesiensis]OOC37568.1 ABC transporter permease [Thermosipho melanesiensis]OOC39464.1 ABC transporter permease [Thermosipho melanesiensis]OOC39527.1 ABC transporter permease [Thermosipho melanesiensis]